MAATFTVHSPVMSHGHAGGHHGHSHSRKPALNGSPLRSASINDGAYQSNGSAAANSFLMPEVQAQHHASKSADDSHGAQQDQNTSTLLKPRPSFSTPTGSRTKSMERRVSAGLPAHLQLPMNGYGFPSVGSQRPRASMLENENRRWITSAELVSSILVPLPYVLASLAYEQLVQVPSQGESMDISDVQATPAWRLAMSMTYMTLLLVGIRGKVGNARLSLDRRKKSLGGEEKIHKQPWSHLARRLCLRFLTVWLPFYTTLQLGAARFTLILLIGLISNWTKFECGVTDINSAQGWRRFIVHHKWTFASILIQMVSDLSGLTSFVPALGIFKGYLALVCSVVILPPAFPSSKSRLSAITSSVPASESSTSAVLATPWEKFSQAPTQNSSPSTRSPLICTPEDINLTLYSGLALAVLVFISDLPSAFDSLSVPALAWTMAIALAAAIALTVTRPLSMQCNQRLGFVIGSLLSSMFSMQLGISWQSLATQSIFVIISFVAMRFDTCTEPSSSTHPHNHRHDGHSHAIHHNDMSQFSVYVTKYAPRAFGNSLGIVLAGILAEKDSRRIFYFTCLNAGFMAIQAAYSLATGSLGLLSDSVHMAFDCLALLVGLGASVMSKWPPNAKFPFGYGKMDSLAGFANGIFLMLISIEIVWEAIEQLHDGHDVKRLGELFTVSTMGLAVNFVGLMSFGHHGHSHGGHDHSHHSHGTHHQHHDHFHPHEHQFHDETAHHDHSHSREHSPHQHDYQHDHPPHSALGDSHSHDPAVPTPSPSMFSSVPATPSKPVYDHIQESHAHGHSHHGHSHSHESDNMYGIYLHVLADALGSVSVIISTVAIYYSGWTGWDALASCAIAFAIFASAVPLVKSSAGKLLLTVPADTEYDLREALSGLMGLRGITGYAVPKFWLETNGDGVLGLVHVIAGRGTDLEDVKERAVAYLKGRRMDVVVQVEREGNSRCWCQAVK